MFSGETLTKGTAASEVPGQRHWRVAVGAGSAPACAVQLASPLVHGLELGSACAGPAWGVAVVTHSAPVAALDEAEILRYRKLAAALLEWACGWPETTAVSEDHPRYQLVTEGRDVGRMQKRYSSCGDLPHWLYETLGVRLDWVNRAPHWRVAQNLILLQAKGYFGKNLIARVWDGTLLDAGDTLIVSNKAHRQLHAVCIIARDPVCGWLATAQYGQPGGALVECDIAGSDSGGIHQRDRLCRVLPGPKLSPGRYIRSVLRLPDVLVAAAAAGKLVPAELPWS